jgi:hypothetical protein
MTEVCAIEAAESRLSRGWEQEELEVRAAAQPRTSTGSQSGRRPGRSRLAPHLQLLADLSVSSAALLLQYLNLHTLYTCVTKRTMLARLPRSFGTLPALRNAAPVASSNIPALSSSPRR